MIQLVPHRQIALAMLIGSLGLGFSLNAQASIVSNLYVQTSAGVDNSGTPDSTANGPSQTYVSTGSAQYGNYSSADANAFGYNYDGGGTRYATSANGYGTFTSQAIFSKSLTITNTENYAQIYDLSYFLYSGSLSVGAWYGTQLGDTGSASLSFRIFEDASNPLLSRNAKLVLSADGSINLDYTGFTAENWGNYATTQSETGSLSLGVLAAGTSKTISYQLIAEATGNYAFQKNNECCYECAPYGEEVATMAVYECGGSNGYSSAFLGDPDGVNGTGTPGILSVSGKAYNAVPLPGSMSLLGIGMAALLTSRRRKSIR